MKKFKNYPRAYKKNTKTKLLWLYKTSIITHSQYLKARFFNAMQNAKVSENFTEALKEVTQMITA